MLFDYGVFPHDFCMIFHVFWHSFSHISQTVGSILKCLLLDVSRNVSTEIGLEHQPCFSLGRVSGHWLKQTSSNWEPHPDAVGFIWSIFNLLVNYHVNGSICLDFPVNHLVNVSRRDSQNPVSFLVTVQEIRPIII